MSVLFLFVFKLLFVCLQILDVEIVCPTISSHGKLSQNGSFSKIGYSKVFMGFVLSQKKTRSIVCQFFTTCWDEKSRQLWRVSVDFLSSWHNSTAISTLNWSFKMLILCIPFLKIIIIIIIVTIIIIIPFNKAVINYQGHWRIVTTNLALPCSSLVA